jgi:hypothetical protein
MVGFENGEAHAFNVANIKNQVIFIDDQKQFFPQYARQTVEQAIRPDLKWSLLYRTR